MKTLFAILLGVMITGVAPGQTPVGTLTGRVLDAKTQQPLPFATVYLNNTTRGTTADSTGNYRLLNVPVGTVELVGSAVGYTARCQPLRLTDSRPHTVDIRLEVSDNALATVTVRAKHSPAWARQFRTFSRELLGNRPMARQCQIRNENSLSFTEEKGHFRAQSTEPLVIENRALGYRLAYTLLYFDLYQGQMHFAGTTQFDELKPADARQLAQWQANRLKVYKGSLHHLLASLVAGTHEQEGFVVYRTPLALDPGTATLPLVRNTERQLIGTEQAKALFRPGELPFERRLVTSQPLEVYYNRIYAGNSPNRDSPYAYSMLLLPNQAFDLTTDGWITQGNGLDVRGYLGDDRLATLLPADWTPADKETLTALAITSGRALRADAGQDSVVADYRRQAARRLRAPLVFVHTDKPVYTTGDQLWFSAYVLDPARHLPVAGREKTTVQVELRAPGGQTVLHQWLRLTDGRAAGSFRIADTLLAGTYRLRAYTTIDSADTRPAFECSFPVYNVRLSGRPALPDQPTVLEPAHSPASPAAIDVQFLPEGGRWLAGVPGKLGIKAVQVTGHGRAVSGRIIDKTGKEITHFTTNALGIGHVAFTPEAGQTYAALPDGLSGADAPAIALPAVEPEGWALSADAYSDSSRLTVTVRATGREPQPVYVTLVARDQLVYHQKWQLTKGEAQFTLPTATLPPGVCQLTVWDHTGRPRAERLVFVPDRGLPVQMRVITAKARYAPREPVAVSFQLRDADQYPIGAFWSAAVTDADQLPEDTVGTDLRTHLLLTGGLRGRVESPLYYLESGKLSAIDDLLLTQGWRRLGASTPADSTGGWAISGQVHTQRGRVLANAPVMLSLQQGSQRMLRTVLTNALGRFRLEGLMIDDTVQVRALTPGTSDAVVAFDRPGALGKAPALSAPDWQALARSLTAARNRQLAYPAFYRDSTARQLAEVVVRATKLTDQRPIDVQRASIHSNADVVFVPKQSNEYTDVASMFQQIPGMNQLIGRNSSSFGDNTPLYLLDGIEANYATVFLNLNVAEISRVELLKNPGTAGIYGSRGANGVIAIYTRKGGEKLAQKATGPATLMQGFVAPREFYVPRYNEPDLPPNADKRDVLYWKALGQSDANGISTVLFTLNDTARQIRLVIQGVTTEGTPIFSTWVLPMR